MNNIIEKWDKIKESIRIEHSLTDISYNTWIRPLKVHGIENNTVIILVPSDHAQSVSYISNKYYLPFKVAIAEELGETYEITFILEKDINQIHIINNENNVRYEKANLKPAYNFDTFVVGENNQFAHSAALAVAESPGEVFNPLFLYGGVGLGKTHLMQAIGCYIIDNNKDANVLYVPSETFTNELITAIRSGKSANSVEAMDDFREKYRNVDVFLIDDIQFIIGRKSTQEEFFHTFNKLHEEKKAIVISSDRPPKDMDILDERIRSRFNWGLLADIQAPDYETRMAILQNKKEMKGYVISDDIMRYIAENITTNIRDLEGALNKIHAYSKLENNRVIDMELAKNALRDIITPREKRNITPEYIIDIVCDHFNISKNELLSKRKSSNIVVPRQIIMYICIKKANITTTATAAALGRDHTTSIHGANIIESDMKTDKELKDNIETLIKKLGLE
ncbi:MAG: chromosomal replication initiator protein DnaA [Lachnospiraceae bacterium]|nr:chromosomal replication initiator protein DnaA [Lachnospiraceae bacterium]